MNCSKADVVKMGGEKLIFMLLAADAWDLSIREVATRAAERKKLISGIKCRNNDCWLSQKSLFLYKD